MSSTQQHNAREINEGPVSADLNDTMMATVVYNGNDALNVPLEAAQQEERGVHNTQVPVAAGRQVSNATATPLSAIANLSHSSLPELSSELTDTWNAYRFVRMRWLSAQENVWYLVM